MSLLSLLSILVTARVQTIRAQECGLLQSTAKCRVACSTQPLEERYFQPKDMEAQRCPLPGSRHVCSSCLRWLGQVRITLWGSNMKLTEYKTGTKSCEDTRGSEENVTCSPNSFHTMSGTGPVTGAQSGAAFPARSHDGTAVAGLRKVPAPPHLQGWIHFRCRV